MEFYFAPHQPACGKGAWSVCRPAALPKRAQGGPLRFAQPPAGGQPCSVSTAAAPRVLLGPGGKSRGQGQGAGAGQGPGWAQAAPNCHPFGVSGFQGRHHVPPLCSCSLSAAPGTGPGLSLSVPAVSGVLLLNEGLLASCPGEALAGGRSWAKPRLPWACAGLSPSRYTSASARWRKKIFGKRTGFQH